MPAAVIIAVALAAVLAGCAADAGGAQGEEPVTGVTQVGMKNLKFEPRSIKVPAGTTVTWLFNDGSVPHNVIGDGFKSPTTATGTFEHRFTTAGTFAYRCDLHVNMTGTVVVE